MSRLLTGIAFVLGACLIWGLIFVVPQYMTGFNWIEVAIGRYFFYGLVSLVFFLKTFLRGEGRYGWAVWKTAFIYSFLFCLGYYPCLVLGLRYASPAISALIMGVGPITIAFYGNWREKECSFRSLIVPSLFILLGLLFVNYPALVENETPTTYLLGLLACLCALLTWTWYVVANARFLKTHAEVSSSDWATLNGVTTLLWVGLFVIATSLWAGEWVDVRQYMISSAFVWGSVVLGVVCSWVGIFLWNRATLYLPMSLAGQLTIFETIFGLLFIYLLEQRLPPLMEGIGIVLFLVAVAYGIKKSSEIAPQVEH